MANIFTWLDELGLGQYADVFDENDVDLDVLPDLSEADLDALGVTLGHRKRLMRAIAALSARRARSDEDLSRRGSLKLAGERRRATVLFSDLTGYTAMTEAMDPEDVEAVMSRIKANAVEIVERHGGIVNQFVGDEVLALFGIPVAHDDDPIRAVRAALEMHEMVRNISPEVERQIGRSVRLHTGVNTGLVVTHRGDDRDGRYGVTGDTVNVGARLRALAESDAILLSANTTRLVRGHFTTAPEPSVRLKGKSESVIPQRVTGSRSVEGRFVSTDGPSLTAFTGRSREMNALEAGLATLLDGAGRVVMISGEAGAGKSRLLFEFRQRIKAGRCRVLHVSCPSSGRERPYAPFIDLLFAGLSLDAEGGGDALVERVIANVIAIDPELERFLAHYLDLLSLGDGRYSLPPNFEGDEKRRAFEEALARFFTLASRQKPIVLILEDWHWSDEASDSALSYLVDRIDACGMYVLVNHRPEYKARWAEAGSHTVLSLGPLGPRDTEAMMARSLGANALPPGLVELVDSRANGNPLFIEELCHSLVEEGIVRVEERGATLTRPIEELELPDTVQGVIRDRLDRLGEATTEPLHLAAVIGKEFSARLLARVHSDALGLDETLAVLVARGVILPVDERVDVEYAFKHVLVQTVVYETLLIQQRRDLHARVGAAIEELYVNRLPNYYESLARHFDLGQVWDRAVDYTVKAGVKAVQHHAIASALRQFDRARQILSEHSLEVSWRARYDLCFHRAVALGDQGKWPLALTELVNAKNLAEQANDVGLRIQAQVARANAAFWAHEFDDSLAITAELEAQLAGSADVRLRIVSLQAMANFMVERLPTALEKEEEARGLLRAHPDSPNRSFAAFVLGTFSRWRGENVAAAEILLPATQLDKQHASAGVYLQSLMHYCLAIGERGQYQAAIDLLLEGREYGLAADSLYGVLKITNTLGWAYLEICNVEKSHEYNQMALEAVEETKGSNTSTLSEVASFTRLNLADLHMASGEFARAREQLEKVASTLGDADFFLARTRWKPRCLIGLGELWLGLGEVETAQAYLAQLDASETADRFPFTKHQVRAARLRAAILSAQGRADAATQTLEEALGRAHRVGNPPELWKVYLALGDLLAEMGEAERASSCHQEACNVVESVAGSLNDPTLKSGFLSAPPIRRVLSRARS